MLIALEKSFQNYGLSFNSISKQDVFDYADKKLDLLNGVALNIYDLNTDIALDWHYFRKKDAEFFDVQNGLLGEINTAQDILTGLRLSLSGIYDYLPDLPAWELEESLTYVAPSLLDFVHLRSELYFYHKRKHYYYDEAIDNKVENSRSCELYAATEKLYNLYFQGAVQVDDDEKSFNSGVEDEGHLERLKALSWEGFNYGYWGKLGYEISNFTAELHYEYINDNLDYGDEMRDKGEQSGKIAFQGEAGFIKDTIFLKASSKITSYEDKREEALSNKRDVHEWFLNPEIVHQFNRHLTFRVEGVYSEKHNIYLYSTTAGDNRTEKTYFVRPQIIFELSPNFRVCQEFPIRASYLIYDYDLKTTYIDYSRHRLLRDGRYILRLESGAEPLAWHAVYSAKIEDYGQLTWEENWLERLMWERYCHNLEIGLDIRLDHNLVIALTNLFEIRDGFDWELSADEASLYRDLNEALTRNKFQVEINYSPSMFWTLSLMGRVRNDFYRGTASDEYISLSMDNTLLF